MSNFESQPDHPDSYIDSQDGEYTEEGYEEEEHTDQHYYGDSEANDSPLEPSKQALDLAWCVGFNYKQINGVINLTRIDPTTGKTIKEIFFSSGHTGVIYSYGPKKRQRLLQGHCNEITAAVYNHEKGILVTADKGPSSLLVVWNVDSGTPIKSIFDPHPNGVQHLDITKSGDQIVTLSREEPDSNGNYSSQTICIWNWEEDGQTCAATGHLRPERKQNYIHYQRYVQFNYNKPEELVTTGRLQVRFWNANEDGTCTSYSPAPKIDEERHYTQTVFIPIDNEKQAVSGTEEGLLVVWDISLIIEQMTLPNHKREIKTINLLNSNNDLDTIKKDKKGRRWKKRDTSKQDEERLKRFGLKKGKKALQKRKKKEKREIVGITVLIATNNLLVIGATNGNVRFYDFQFRIEAWFEEEVGLAGVTSISLSHQKLDEMKMPHGRKHESVVSYPDFIVADRKAKIVLLHADQFNNENVQKNEGEVLVQSILSSIVSIALKPKGDHLFIACHDGRIFQWEYVTKDMILTELEHDDFSNEPTCMKFSPDGNHLVITTKVKGVQIYRGSRKGWQSDLLVSNRKEFVHGIDIAFSCDSKTFAVIDNLSSVSLFKLDNQISKDSFVDWYFVGKIKTHLLEINGLAFGEYYDKEQQQRKSKFYTIGKDKLLFCYNAEESKNYKVEVESFYKIETESEPTACLWYPVNYLKEEILMVATSDYKIKLWDTCNGVCRQTFLGPTYGSPISSLLQLNVEEKDTETVPKYVAYTTKEKIVGIIRLPLDGNPNKTMGMIAHPGKIQCMTASANGNVLLTAGGDAIGTVNMWNVNYRALEEEEKMQKAQDPNPLETYPNLLEGGVEGEIYSDLQNFFYFSQIDSKTENPTKAKKLDGKIPKERVQSLMQALGYYPTQLEVNNMIDEVSYSKYLERDQIVDNLELDTFVKLFINHRPVYGLTMDQIKEKMSILSRFENDEFKKTAKGQKKNEGKKEDEEEKRLKQDKEDKGIMDKGLFIKMLKSGGEAMTEQELQICFDVLMGNSDYKKALPDTISSEYLIKNVLGFELDDTTDAINEEGQTQQGVGYSSEMGQQQEQKSQQQYNMGSQVMENTQPQQSSNE